MSSFNQIGYIDKIRTPNFNQTFNTTLRAYAPYPTALPSGVYIISTWVYSNPLPSGAMTWIDLIGSTSVIASGASTGFSAGGDGAFPPSQYVLFNRVTRSASIPDQEVEINLCGTVVISNNIFIAVAVLSCITTPENGAVELQITRLA